MNKILFDMDGTLYWFENWQYRWSNLEKQIEENAFQLLQVLDQTSDPTKKFLGIKEEYGEDFSLAYEELFWLDKQQFFETVWDVKPELFINDNRGALNLFEYLKKNWFDIYVLSESPKIWIKRVLTFLNVKWIITWVFSWQWDERKSNGLLYTKVSEEIWSWYYMIWDQIQSDVVMSKESWYRPIYINSEWQKCDLAEFNISNLEEIKSIIE